MPPWLYLGLLAPVLIVCGLLAGCCIRGAAWICRARNASWRRALAVGVLLQLLGAAVYLGLVWAPSAPAPLLIGLLALMLAVFVTAFMAVRWAARATWGRSLAVVGVYAAINGAMGIGYSLALRRTVYDTYHLLYSNGMEPTLGAGDRFMADRTLFPGRWDIAVFRLPSEPNQVVVKRLVGLPGETVELRAGEVYVNGRLAPKPAALSWLSYDSTPLSFLGRGSLCRGGEGSPMTLGPDEFYVLGDKKGSNDSRYWSDPGAGGHQAGAVARGMIIGTARVIYSPPGRRRLLR
jgi:signal peptidase I